MLICVSTGTTPLESNAKTAREVDGVLIDEAAPPFRTLIT